MKTGIVLLNMGGPEKLEDVRPFLYNLFSDRELIKLGPALMQRPLAWYISRKRAPKSRNLYAQIGGGSPLTQITAAQTEKLGQLLAGRKAATTFAMRYWQPRASQAIAELEAAQVERIVLLPLYPHYSKATNGSSIRDFENELAKSRLGGKIRELIIIRSWPDQPDYINCLTSRIEQGLLQFSSSEITILYSAHNLPVSMIEGGDPYVEHLGRTIEAVEAKTGKKGILCYQSRSGPVEWLSPSTSDTIAELAAKGSKNILVVPISFVSDHVETLYEIEIMFRQEAEELGVNLQMTKGLNDEQDFIQALGQLVLPWL
ncbi:MAG: ferrochelatase [Deltaproteobacteria bacterium]|nr:MAG: ferrochelatase [Deltaproteobacteria bacterium]